MAEKQKQRKLAVPELIIPDGVKSPPLLSPSPASSARPALSKQLSQKGNCLCSPTTHAGSFRCRHHRGSSLHRSSGSFGSELSELGGGVSFNSRLSSGLSELREGARPSNPRLAEIADETAAGDEAATG